MVDVCELDDHPDRRRFLLFVCEDVRFRLFSSVMLALDSLIRHGVNSNYRWTGWNVKLYTVNADITLRGGTK